LRTDRENALNILVIRMLNLIKGNLLYLYFEV
jgi:hypothetical protein